MRPGNLWEIRNGELQMTKSFLALVALALLPVATACNTIEGVGKDVKATGEVVEETAKDVKEEITN